MSHRPDDDRPAEPVRKAKRNAAKARAVRLRYQEKRYLRGLCVTCPNERLPDRVSCAACIAKAAGRRSGRKRAGTCSACGKVPPVDGSPRCAGCRSYQNVYSDRLRSRSIALGLCVSCRKVPAEDGRRKCRGCADVSNHRQRLKRGSKPLVENGQMGANGWNTRGAYTKRIAVRSWTTDRADALVALRERETKGVKRSLVDRELVARIDAAIAYLNRRRKRQKAKK